MFIKRNRTRHGGKEYESVLLVQGRRVPTPRPSGRPRKGEPRGTVVVHETLANLSKLPPGVVSQFEFVPRLRRADSYRLERLAASNSG